MSGEPYRAPLPAPPDPYLVAWADLRRRRRWMRLGWAIVCGAWLFVLLHPPGFLHWVAYSVAYLVVVLLALAQGCRCPRCAAQMVGFWPRWQDWERCRHCGIKVGTPKALATRVESLLRVEDSAPTDAGHDDLVAPTAESRRLP